MAKGAEQLADAYATNEHQETQKNREAYAPPTIFPEEVVHSCLAPSIWLYHISVVSCVGHAHLAMQQAVAHLAISIAFRTSVNLLIPVEPRWAEVDTNSLLWIEIRPFW